jgi:tRNA(Ile)-lysidine synthase
MLVQRVQNFIHQNALINTGDRVAVAYSGGPDSTTLLLILTKIFRQTEAIYVNHNLRQDSATEEEFVRQFCAEHKIKLHVEQIQWKKKPSGLEEAARKRRYRHLEKVAKEQGFSRIALAHHQDDLVETILLRLLRGTGPRGLPGMTPKRGKYVRPLLCVSRKEIQQFLADQSVPTYSDPSNENTQFLRNRVRNELLPYLETRFNPAARSAILRLAAWFDEQNSLISELIQPLTKQISEDERGSILDRKIFLKSSAPVQKELIRQALLKADPLFRMSSRTFENILKTIQSSSNVELTGFLMVQCTPEKIHFSQKTGQPGLLEIDVAGTGIYQFPPANTSLKFSIIENREISFSPQNSFLDADKAAFPLTIRNWKKGDSFQPLGMKGKKKLSDFWIDRKVARTERKKIPLIFKDDQLVCIPGLEIDENFKVTPKTRQVLKIERDV